nr:GAF domain-containing protein [uncultured Desulfobulbus sp.]
MIDSRTSDLDFFTNLDKVNRAMQGTHDVEQMMTRVLDELLTIFNCDRATLMYPCDPEAASYSSPMERTNPLYPGIFELGLTLPMTPSVQELFRRVLQTDGPVTLNLGKGIDPQEEPWKTFAIQSVLGIALYPKVGPPWKLGLHQCSHERIWSPGEQKLFLEISRRLSDGLTSLLMYRNLKESESFLDTCPSLPVTELFWSASMVEIVRSPNKP